MVLFVVSSLKFELNTFAQVHAVPVRGHVGAGHGGGVGPGQVTLMEENVQNALQSCSGGNFDNFIHKEFSGI